MDAARSPRIFGDPWRVVLLLTAALTLARLMALFVTPLDLYPDEAQYWLWSRTLDLGYYSKPPVVAWTIWATTALGGDAEPWVRLASPLYHAGATLTVFAIGRRLYGEAAGLAGAALYALMPGVQLSAAIMATDAPLLFFLSLALLAYVELQGASGRRQVWLAAGFGTALGLAFLSKYAAIYVVIGVVAHLAASRPARAAWRPAGAAAALGALAVILAPNIAWNAGHHFATFHHTAANAAWGGRQLFNAHDLGDFLASQFGVFGPIPFAVLLGGTAVLAARRRLTSADLLLLCFTLPPLLIVSVQSFISRANANWSGASYLPGAILVAAWLVRWRAKRWLGAAIALQAVLAVLFLVWVTLPATADAMGAANSFKRAKGWSQISRMVLDRAEREPGLTAIAVNNRFLYNAIAYYGRDDLANPATPPLKVWLLAEAPQNQAETTAPLTPAEGGRVLGVVLEDAYRDRMMADFAAVSDRELVSVRLDRKRQRRAELFIGERFAPKPRAGPVSAPPTPP
jgi:4-amino-4-deoxy-L-arabinose transferase-like glycosyltransferase